MKITPIEIRQKQFEKKTFGGIDKEEVAAYLQTLSEEWERMNEELRIQRERLSAAESEIIRHKEIESSLYKTLKTAEETGASMVEQAKQSSSLQVREAELRAESILKEAKWQAKSTIEEAKQEVKNIYSQVKEQTTGLEREVREIERYRDNLLGELRLIATDIGEKAERYQTKVQTVDLGKLVAEQMPTTPPMASYQPEAPEEKELGEGNEKSFFDSI
jgi:cell division initiation protein